MKTVTATVNYPAYIKVEVPDDISEDDLREKILSLADDQLINGPIKPVIHECSEEDLID